MCFLKQDLPHPRVQSILGVPLKHLWDLCYFVMFFSLPPQSDKLQEQQDKISELHVRLEMAMPNLCVPELLENLHLVTATQRPHTAPLTATQPHGLNRVPTEQSGRGLCQKVSWSSAFLLCLAAISS